MARLAHRAYAEAYIRSIVTPAANIWQRALCSRAMMESDINARRRKRPQIGMCYKGNLKDTMAAHEYEASPAENNHRFHRMHIRRYLQTWS